MPGFPNILPGMELRELLLPFAPPVKLLVLADPCDLIGKDAAQPDREVYWGALWPSALVLTDELLRGALRFYPSDPILELGCGAGLVSIAAALAGAHQITAADIEPRALELTLENARRNGVAHKVQTLQLDWRKPSAKTYPLILAADCLYVPEAGKEICAFLRSALARKPEARAIIADPERWSAQKFQFEAQEAGFVVQQRRSSAPFVPELGSVEKGDAGKKINIEITIYELRWAKL